MSDFWRQPVVWVVAGAVAVGGLLVVALVFLKPHSPVPAAIARQLHFSVFYPDGTDGYSVKPATVSYDGQAKVLLLHAQKGDSDLTISEQATPDTFNDIPEYYSKLVEKLNGYADFDSANGHVSLTLPQELHGGQSAVFNSKGTLMFVHPNHNLSNDAWRKFFDGLMMSGA